MEQIEWKQFRNTIYSVSNTGLVRNNETNKLLNGGIDTAGYRFVYIHENNEKHAYGVHVLVGIVFLGFIQCGRNKVIHHKDGVKTNNHKDNLEIVTFRANCSIERTAKSSSKYVGVSYCNTYKKWRAAIRIKGKLKFLGYFKEEIDAHNAYQKALLELS